MNHNENALHVVRPLRHDWLECWDAYYGTYYYYNSRTQLSQEEYHPETPPLSPHAYFGSYYYYNSYTQLSQEYHPETPPLLPLQPATLYQPWREPIEPAVLSPPAAPGTVAAIAIEELSHANLKRERQVWCLAKAEAGKAKRSGNAERIAKARIALAIATRAVKAAATAVATGAPTHRSEAVVATATATAAVTVARVVELAKQVKAVATAAAKACNKSGQSSSRNSSKSRKSSKKGEGDGRDNHYSNCY